MARRGHGKVDPCPDLRYTSPMRLYTGVRTLRGVRVHVTDDQDPSVCDLLAPRSDLKVCWPRSFDWAYAGGSPSQLALALCADALGGDKAADDTALSAYLAYTSEVVANLPYEGWMLTQREIAEAATEMANRKRSLSPV
jgi:hypothetical protein